MRVAVVQIQMRDSALYPTRPPYLCGADSTRGGILDGRELRHLRDHVGDVLHALWSHLILGETASNASYAVGQIQMCESARYITHARNGTHT